MYSNINKIWRLPGQRLNMTDSPCCSIYGCPPTCTEWLYWKSTKNLDNSLNINLETKSEQKSQQSSSLNYESEGEYSCVIETPPPSPGPETKVKFDFVPSTRSKIKKKPTPKRKQELNRFISRRMPTNYLLNSEACKVPIEVVARKQARYPARLYASTIRRTASFGKNQRRFCKKLQQSVVDRVIRRLASKTAIRALTTFDENGLLPLEVCISTESNNGCNTILIK